MFETEDQLDEALSSPDAEVIRILQKYPGDVVLAGAGGKMGLSLARMVRRGRDLGGSSGRVIAVSRFQSLHDESSFQQHGIETLRCELLNEGEVAALPDAAIVIALAGMKFGATGNESLTWAMNALVPSLLCRRYANARILAFSTGNVYGLSSVADGGSRETDVCRPDGEYAMSCLGRERVYEYYSRTQSIPISVIRLNYACDLRYGVLVDIAQRIRNGEPIPLSMGYFNTIWQGDANRLALRSLEMASSPPWVVNVTGRELLSVRAVAETMGQKLHRTTQFSGHEAVTALLSHTGRVSRELPSEIMPAEVLIDAVVSWVQAGNRLLSRPTHFESRDGKF